MPRGWQWYATRGYSERLDATVREFEAAKAHAAGATVQFLVYGGGEAVRTLSVANGWLWHPEQRDIAKGRYSYGEG